MLEQSSANLRSTTVAHDTLSTLLSTSKHLITALEKSDWLDRLLILAAVAFFFLIVLFILKQRVVDKGIRIAFWWTRFLPDFSGDGELLSTTIVETGTVAATVTAATSSAASSFVTTTNAGLPSSSPNPDVDTTVSTLVPSGSTIPTPDTDGVDDAIREILSSTVKPSPSPSMFETSTVLQSNPSAHQEL